MRLLLIPLLFLSICSTPPPEEEPIQPPDLSHLPWLVKDSSLYEYLSVDTAGVTMFGDTDSVGARSIEFRVEWEDVARFKELILSVPLDSALAIYSGDSLFETWNPQPFPRDESEGKGPLAGLRIAIDPGHAAPDLTTAVIEDRFVKVRAKEAGTAKEIAFFEADLALKTALILRDSLMAAGAEVMLTRNKPGGVLGGSFDRWKTTGFDSLIAADLASGRISQKPVWSKKMARKVINRRIYRSYYNRLDIEERARLVNTFRPDLTVIIHYNIGGADAGMDDYISLVDENFGMMFIPGGFAKGELGHAEDRMLFLYKLLSTDVAKSKRLSAAVMDQHVDLLGVPAVEEPSGLRYLEKYSVYADHPGVYARNLKLTRLINSPMVFGESLLQNNRQEVLRLAGVNDSTEQAVPTRIQEVARAYYLGVMDFAGEE